MLNELLTFDSGSVIFWSITYICVIVRGFKGEKLLLPSLSIYLNLGWEICSIFVNNNWKNWLWLLLDCVIFIIMIIQKRNGFAEEKKSSKTIIAIVVLTLTVANFTLVFSTENGMLFSSFAIDIIMAVGFLAMMLISPQNGRSIPIAVTKLIGDFCAWQYYRSYAPLINTIGITVLILNCVYLLLSFKPIHKGLLMRIRNHNSERDNYQ